MGWGIELLASVHGGSFVAGYARARASTVYGFLRRVSVALAASMVLSPLLALLPLGPVGPSVRAAVVADSAEKDGDGLRGLSGSRTSPWDPGISVDVQVPSACRFFIYASPSWPIAWFRFFPSVDTLFLYYTRDVHAEFCEKLDLLHGENRRVHAVFDPGLPGNGTMLDLYYDLEMQQGFVSELGDLVSNLALAGVDGFVLGDEWPRGCSTGMITVQTIAAHNATYHQETGRWMRPDGGSRLEKAQLAEWFYRRSIEVWNAVANELRTGFPHMVMGTNLDLFWKPDYGSDELPMWKSGHWIGELDINPYDFLVCHYFTLMPRTVGPEEVDDSRLQILDSVVGMMQAAAQTGPGGKDLYILLAAHYNDPRVVSPAQMLAEWNLLSGHNVSGIGWFAFDSWETGITARWRENSYVGWQPSRGNPLEPSVYIPFRVERTLMVRILSSIREEADAEARALQLSEMCAPSKKIEIPYLQTGEEYMVHAAYSPSGRYLLSVAQTRIQIRDANETSRVIRTINARGGLFASGDWSPDERFLACTTTDGHLVILETGLDGGQSGAEWTGDGTRCQLGLGPLGRVAWSSQGEVIACEAAGGVLLMRARGLDLDSHRKWLVRAGDRRFGLCGWSADGEFIAISGDDSVEIWRVIDAEEATRVMVLPSAATNRAGGSWSPQGSLLAVVTGNPGREMALVHDAATNETAAEIQGIRSIQSAPHMVIGDDRIVVRDGSRSEILALAWDAKGSCVAVGTEDGHIYLLNVTARSVAGHAAPARLEIEEDPAGWLPADCCDPLWFGVDARVDFEVGPILSLSFSIEPGMLALADPAGVLFLNVTAAGMRRLRTVSTDEGMVGFVIIGLLPGARPSGQVPVSDPAFRGPVLSMDWSEPDLMLAIAMGEPENRIKVLEIRPDGSNELVACLWDSEGPVDASFSPEGGVLAFSTEAGSTKLWSLADGCISVVDQVAPGSGTASGKVDYSPDGKWLALVRPSREVWVFDAGNTAHRRLLCTDASCVAWSPDGDALAVGSSQGIGIWSLTGSTPLEVSECASCPGAGSLVWFRTAGEEIVIAVVPTDVDGLGEIGVFKWSDSDLSLVDLRRFAYRWGDAQGDQMSWSASSGLVAIGCGLDEYRDSWRDEWVKDVVLGSVCLTSVSCWFEDLRPGVLILECQEAGTAVRCSFPTHTDAVSGVVWLGAAGLLATGSVDGSVLLWDVRCSRDINELGMPEMLGAIMLLVWLLVSRSIGVLRKTSMRRCP